MKRLIISLMLGLALLFIVALAKAQSAQSALEADSTSAPYCDSTLWNHVYHKYRLNVIKKCITVTGKVASMAYEKDGDIHIRVKVDSQFAWMINDSARKWEGGNLVCEPVCATKVTQTDAISSCVSFKNTVFIPTVGEYVAVTGPYCFDKEHGWNELHPITSVSIIYHTNTSDPGVEKAQMTVFPNPATDLISFKLTQKPSSPVFITIMDGIGRSAGQYQMMNKDLLQITTTYLPAGIYYYNLVQNNAVYKSGRFVVIHNR